MQYSYEIIVLSSGREKCENLLQVLRANFARLTIHEIRHPRELYEFIEDNQNIMVIIVDLELTDEPPAEVYTRIQDLNAETPVYFYGPKNLSKTHIPDNIYLDNAANDYLEYPFRLDTIAEKINLLLKIHEERQDDLATIEANPENYVSMKIRSFFRFDEVPYDAFISVGDGYFRKVIQANVKYPQSEIIKHVKKGHKFLFFERKEYLEFLEKSIQVLLKIYKTSKQGSPQVYTVQVTSASITQEYIRSLGVSENLIKLVNETITWTRKMFQSRRSFSEIIKDFPMDNFDLATQSILTAYLCECMLSEMEWPSDIMRKKLGLSSLICDGFLTNEELRVISSLNDPRLKKLSEKDIKEFNEHVTKAVDVCQYFSGYSDVDFIIAEHHELPMAKGFPRKLNGFDLQPISCIFIIANNFISGLTDSGFNSKAKVKEQLEKFNQTYNEGNFKDALKVLKKVMGDTIKDHFTSGVRKVGKK